MQISKERIALKNILNTLSTIIDPDYIHMSNMSDVEKEAIKASVDFANFGLETDPEACARECTACNESDYRE